MLYWLWLATRRGISLRRLLELLRYFASPEEIFRASRTEYLLAGLTDDEMESLCDKSLDGARQIVDDCRRLRIHILTYQDAAYPNRLRNIADPPLLLYYAGTLPDIDAEPVVTVVGSRKATAYGLMWAKRLGYQIAMCGGVVASGLARGIDAMAMTGAVSTGRPVIGVLGCGLDQYYPKENRHLQEDVAAQGCLLSEYPPGTPPLGRHFPVRNRILSGIAVATVVVEAPEKSGALITAHQALDQGRDVYAVPGHAGTPNCAGSNRLLKEGAILVECGWDVMQWYAGAYPDRVQEYRYGQWMMPSAPELRMYGDTQAPVPDEKLASTSDSVRKDDKKSVDNPESGDYIDVQAVLQRLSGDEQQIYRLLDEPRVADELAEACSLPSGRVQTALTMLELKGYIERLPGSRYRRGGSGRME